MKFLGPGSIVFHSRCYLVSQHLLSFSKVGFLDRVSLYSRASISRFKMQETVSTESTRLFKPIQMEDCGSAVTLQVPCLRRHATTFKPRKHSVEWSRYKKPYISIAWRVKILMFDSMRACHTSSPTLSLYYFRTPHDQNYSRADSSRPSETYRLFGCKCNFFTGLRII